MLKTVVPATVLAIGLIPGPAGAAVSHPKVVSANPVNRTPHVLDGIVNAFAIVGDRVVVGGSFERVRNAGSDDAVSRTNIFAFSLKTGRIDPRFAPEVDGTVFALARGDGGTVYAGGSFSLVNGDVQPGLARLDLGDGTTSGTVPRVSPGSVFTMARHGSDLYIGGDFQEVGSAVRPAVARLRAGTGSLDTTFDVTPAKSLGGRTRVHALAVNRAGTRLAMDGSFMAVDGARRPQLALVDLAGRARLAKWSTEAYAGKCTEHFPWYVRGLDFSPKGDYFVVVTTGGWRGGGPMCDTAARFETDARGTKIKPTWVNHTGGDSLYSVAVTGPAVYVGGHQRWLDNPKGKDSKGPGAVSRPGIGAIGPKSGEAMAWNPTRERGIGVKAFLAHKGGLLVGSDTEELGKERHGRVGMFPL